MDESEKRLLAFLIVLILLITFTKCVKADEVFAYDTQGCIYVKRAVPRIGKPGIKRKAGKSAPKTHPDEWDVIGCGTAPGIPAGPVDILPPLIPEVPFEPFLPPTGLYTPPGAGTPLTPPVDGTPAPVPEYLPPMIWTIPPHVVTIPIHTPPIPEPATWLFLISGVGLLLVARGRARSSP